MFDYVLLKKLVIYKRRYDSWYLIDMQRKNKDRFLLENGAGLVMSALLKGKSIRKVRRGFNLKQKKINEFLDVLIREGLLEFSSFSVDSSNKCFDIDPPLDALNLLITNKCNLRCVHCYSSSGKPMINELSGDQWIRVLEEGKKLGAFQVNISGGEPTLHPDFLQIVEYLASVATFKTNLNTNGFLLPDGWEYSIAKAFDNVQVSIDNPDLIKHDIFRQKKGCFKKSLASIERLQEAGVQTSVGFVLTPESIDNLEELICLCEKIGVKKVNVGLVANVGRAKSNKLVTIQQDGKPDLVFMGHVYRKMIDVSQRVSCVEIDLPFRVDSNFLEVKEKNRICDGDNNQIVFIMPDGNVLPCEKLPVDRFACGNVTQQSLSDIWHTEKMKYFKLMNPRQLSKCGNCSLLKMCGGACVARAFHSCGSLDSPDWTSCIIAEMYNKTHRWQ